MRFSREFQIPIGANRRKPNLQIRLRSKRDLLIGGRETEYNKTDQTISTNILNLTNVAYQIGKLSDKVEASTYKVALPPIALQNQFAAFVTQVDKSKFVVAKS